MFVGLIDDNVEFSRSTDDVKVVKFIVEDMMYRIFKFYFFGCMEVCMLLYVIEIMVLLFNIVIVISAMIGIVKCCG